MYILLVYDIDLEGWHVDKYTFKTFDELYLAYKKRQDSDVADLVHISCAGQFDRYVWELIDNPCGD